MRRTLAVMLPSIVLLAVASTQMIFARTASLSPWKGGGFGMFASVDGLPFRFVRLYVFATDRSEAIEVPPSLADLADRVATFPHQRAMEKLARATIARERRRNQPVERVRVEIWRTKVSPSLDVTEALERVLTVAVHEAGRTGNR
jgi:hypothetical protein